MENKKIVVVLGSGRSGTSILMQILNELGMSVSKNLIGEQEQTPTGAFEDAEIVKIQNRFINEMTPHSMPVPTNWNEHPMAASTVNLLQEIVKERISKAPTTWGFKDPRTVLLIPMWTKIFNNLDITPKYILSSRNPNSVVCSFRRQYNYSENVSELIWLIKNTEALFWTGGNCFIVNYEDWFTAEAPEIALKLMQYCHLESSHIHEDQIEIIVKNLVQPNLNRAIYNDYQVKNKFALKLYSKLSSINGSDFDRQDVMDVVLDCRRSIDEFSGWIDVAQKIYKRNMKFLFVENQNDIDVNYQKIKTENEKLRNELNKSLSDASSINVNYQNMKIENENLKNELEKSITEVNDYFNKYKMLSDKSNDLQIELSANNKHIKKKTEMLRNAEKQITFLRNSTSFKMGQIIINAFIKPGKNTIMAPILLTKLLFSSSMAKKR